MKTKVRTIELNELPFKLASYNVFGNFSPCIFKSGNEYRIRILTGNRFSGQRTTTSWDYFETDSSGLIISSPRGFAKHYNKKVIIKNVDSMIEEYKDKIINQF